MPGNGWLDQGGKTLTTSVTPEQLGAMYWRKMRRAAIFEVELKLSNFKHATPNTIRYWLSVHSFLESKAAQAERKALK